MARLLAGRTEESLDQLKASNVSLGVPMYEGAVQMTIPIIGAPRTDGRDRINVAITEEQLRLSSVTLSLKSQRDLSITCIRLTQRGYVTRDILKHGIGSLTLHRGQDSGLWQPNVETDNVANVNDFWTFISQVADFALGKQAREQSQAAINARNRQSK